jgi:hypothetical protein
MLVVIYQDTDPDKLEERINSFLTDQHVGEVKQIAQSSHGKTVTITILYEPAD